MEWGFGLVFGSRILFFGNRLGSSIVEIGNEGWSGF